MKLIFKNITLIISIFNDHYFIIEIIFFTARMTSSKMAAVLRKSYEFI